MDEKKRKYAKFLIQRCLSMKAGEPLLISYLTEQQDFVKIVIEEAKRIAEEYKKTVSEEQSVIE